MASVIRESTMVPVMMPPSIYDPDYEDPPPYSPCTAPLYTALASTIPYTSHSWPSSAPFRELSQPTLKYQLCQFTYRHQSFRPIPPGTDTPTITSDLAEYTIKRTFGANFSKTKPDLIITRCGPAASEAKEEDAVATIRYARSGPLPWVPRAQIRYSPATSPSPNGSPCTTQDMELGSGSYGSWFVSIGGRQCHWFLSLRPIKLELVDDQTGEMIACFMYSKAGTQATRGAAVGRLSIVMSEERPLGKDYVEKLLCSCCVAVTYWRDEGKVLLNPSEEE